MKKNEKEFKEKRELREQQEAAVLRRVLLWLCVTVILEAYVLLTNRFLFHYRVGEIDMIETLRSAYGVSQFVFLGLCVVFGVWSYTAAKKTQGKGVLRSIVAGMFGAAAVCSFLFLRTGLASISVLQVAIPVMGVLILIYYLYQKEFFAISSLCAMGILGLWMFRTGGAQYPVIVYSYMGVAVAVIVLCAVGFAYLQKHEGMINALRFLPKDGKYSPVYVTCALVAALLLLPLVLGVVFAYYAIVALVIWVFIMAVYFTAKLM